MASRVFRWGILGTGRIAHDFTLALTVVEDARVVAVGSRSESSAAKFAQDHNISKSYGTYEELVNDAEIDIIYVATPAAAHRDNVLLALGHNKHVLCEKPFALNAKQAAEMIQSAQEKKLFLMEANWMPFFPLIKKTRELIAAGAIGEIKNVASDLGWVNDHAANPSILDPAQGGGSLLAAGVYSVSLPSFIFGEVSPATVSATGSIHASGVDERVVACLSYSNGRTAVAGSAIDCAVASDAVISGTKGRIRIHGIFVCPTAITLTPWFSTGLPEETFSSPVPQIEGSFNFPNSSGLSYEARAVQAHIAEGKTESDVVTHALTLGVMKTLDAIRGQIGVVYPGESS
eukprot:Opistho-2@69219